MTSRLPRKLKKRTPRIARGPMRIAYALKKLGNKAAQTTKALEALELYSKTLEASK